MKNPGSKIYYPIMIDVIILMLSNSTEMLSASQLKETDNNAVVNVGDSFFIFSGDNDCQLHADSGETFRHRAICGTQMIGEIMGPPVPNLSQAAKKNGPNKKSPFKNGCFLIA